MAHRLSPASLSGAAEMMLKSPLSLDELITQVSSPGGTTVKGLQALDRCGFDQAVLCCIDDCVERAYELGQIECDK